MNPGLLVKLRPTGPWRIGPDSGARNRVDAIYHSDSLYSAVTAAMAQLGELEEWLDATARHEAAAVWFGSCFPFQDDLAFVVPPRTIWPPASPSATSARVRWRSARFVPLPVVQALLAGQPPDEDHWSVDGASECLMPAGRPGPFRTAVRWSAAVDRLTGATERHSIGCIEFRPGAGLWTVVSFEDAAARARWAGPVRAAFRVLADSGFGGERSRGWGRSEPPEFVEGDLPEMILPPAAPAPASVAPAILLPAPEPQLEPVEQSEPSTTEAPGLPTEEAAASTEATSVEPVVDTPSTPGTPDLPESSATAAVESTSSIAVLEMEEIEEPVEAPTEVEPELAPVAEQVVVVEHGPKAHWLLSLFTPAPGDSVDWRRGNYTVLARGGRIESPAGSGELKKQVQMVAEGSVVYAESAPRGSAADVAPGGFAHPVFRAGFALAIPLPEVH
jgi:CRISPR type III-A-associated RAMP protein Csm4